MKRIVTLVGTLYSKIGLKKTLDKPAPNLSQNDKISFTVEELVEYSLGIHDSLYSSGDCARRENVGKRAKQFFEEKTK